MSTLVFPPSLTPSRVEWSLDQNVITNESPLSWNVQRSVRAISRWRASIQMPPLVDEDKAIFEAFLSQVSRGDRHFYLSHPHTNRGSFDSSELLVNGDFTNGTTGWSVSSGETFTVGSRVAKLRTTDGGTAVALQSINLTAGDAVVFIADSYKGTATSIRHELIPSGSSAIISQDATPPARIIGHAEVGGSVSHTLRLRMIDNAIGNTTYWQYASLSKCLLVNGASQTGNTLTVDHAPANTNGLLKAGDMFTVMIGGVPSLHRLTRDFDSHGSGGHLYFEPALPGSPADDAPVILNRAFTRMMLPQHSYTASYTPPMFGGFAFDAVEDITR